MTSNSDDTQRLAALDYHEFPRPGKLETKPTKPLANPRDLSRAYSPGVAEACLAISDDPQTVSRFTARGNLVAVVTNGSAALGLGEIGPLASKPIMEGKAVLFKKFADIDCFDIELDEHDPEKLAEHVIALEPTFGAINLEDIKAPDCFIVEKICRERMNIPVFHDDQHGTAIVVAAAVKNALHLTKRKFEDIKIVSTGGGAAGIACLNLLVKLGVRKKNIWLYDLDGLVHKSRSAPINPQKARFARTGTQAELAEALVECDLFLGLSGPGVLTPDMVRSMADEPIVMALANPVPEIMPEDVYKAAPNAIVATGRSDYPNQVNNVLCFPFIFRGALDVAASEINDEMKIACVAAIADLARQTSSAETAAVYQGEQLRFGKSYLIPKPFDNRLLQVIAPAVGRAAINTGVAGRPIPDFKAYSDSLASTVYRSSMLMRPVFDAARSESRKIAFAEGEDERVLRAAVAMIEETIDEPILIGRPGVIASRCKRLGLPARVTKRFEIVNPESDSRFRTYWTAYYAAMKRHGVTPDLAQAILRTNTTVIGAVMVHLGEAASLICGTFGQYLWHLKYIVQMLGTRELSPVGALSLLIMDDGPLFVADTQVHPEPHPSQIAETAIGAARHVRRFGLEPRVALCSNSQFGDLDTVTAQRMRDAIRCLDELGCDFQYEGEMRVDAAIDAELRNRLFRDSRLAGRANVLVFANTEIANAVRNTLKAVAGGIEVGPILMGMGNRAHIVTSSITVRGLTNIAALAGTPVGRYA
ncbi:MAG: NADP-dependent malic enzyme [Hyphomicrobiaceae bacterium]